MPQNAANDINKLVAETEKAVRDGAYVVVGLGLLGFQKAQVHRHELTKRLRTVGPEGGPGSIASQLGETGERLGVQWSALSERLAANGAATRQQLSGLAKTIDERVTPARRQLDERFDAIEAVLPPAARTVFESLRAAAAVPEARLRSAVGLTD